GDPENVNVRAATVIEQFEEQVRDLGWDVPVETGNNDKGPAIEEMIERLGCYWIDADGIPLFDEDDNFREPTLAELADGATRVPPTLFFHQTVVDGAREMAKYKWKDWASAQVAERHNAPETPVDKDDHTITNLIRFMNRLREFRPEGGIDLEEFQGRRKPREWKPIDQAARERHERAAARYRKRLRKLRQQCSTRSSTSRPCSRAGNVWQVAIPRASARSPATSRSRSEAAGRAIRSSGTARPGRASRRRSASVRSASAEVHDG